MNLDEVAIVDDVNNNCSAVANFSATGFSIMPFVATSLAEDILLSKAEDFHVNRVVIDSKEGVFRVNLEATGYFCRI